MAEQRVDMSKKRTEAAAVALMRMVLIKYAQKNGVSLAEALDSFVRSGTYDDLFDLSLRYWAEGPTYILDIWENRRPVREC